MTKQIGFIGLKEDALVESITNGQTLPQPVSVAQLVDFGYTWENNYLYIDVDESAPQQTLTFTDLSTNTSVDFFGGRPPRIDE